MTIRKQLLSGYIIIALAVLFVGYFSAQATKELNATFDAVTVRTVPVIDAVNDLRYFGARALTNASELALIFSSSISGVNNMQKKKQEQELEDAFSDYRSAIDHYKSLVSDRQSERDREVLSMIVSTSTRLQYLLRELHGLGRQGVSADDLLLKLDEIEAYELTFLYAVDAALAFEVEQFNVDRDGVEQAIAQTRNIAVIFGPASVLAAVLITIYLSRAITSSLVELKNASLAVAAGNWGIRVPHASPGEFDDVIKTFNDMASALNSKAVDVSSSEAYCHEILDSMSEPLVVTSLDGKIRTVNAATLRLLQVSEQDLIGKPIVSLFGKSYRENVRQQWLPRLRKGNGISHEKTTYVNGEQQEIPMIVSASSMRGHNGVVDGIVYMAKVLPNAMIS